MKFEIKLQEENTLREKIKNNIDEIKDCGEIRVFGPLGDSDFICLKQITGTKGFVKSLDIANTDGLTVVDRYTFEEGNILSSVKLPSSVEKLGWGAFCMSDRLTNVSMPSTIDAIDNYAFNGCSSLKSITLPSKLAVLGNQSLGDCPKLEEIKIASTNKTFSTTNGILYSRNGEVLIKYPAGKTDIKFVIDNDIQIIHENAFFMCENLLDVVLSNNLKKIGKEAFCSCTGIQHIVIPASTTHIGTDAFKNCKSLIEISIESENPPAYLPSDDELILPIRIYVPSKSLEKYKNDEGWGKFTRIFGK